MKANEGKYTYQLDNPVSGDWIKTHLTETKPRLLLNPHRVNEIRAQIGTDTLTGLYYEWAKANADFICEQEPLVRKLNGKRMLAVSRQALNRITALSLTSLFEEDNQPYLERLNQEMLAVCSFKNWNPNHFLDTAEMALAVSIGLDWCHNLLPEETVRIGKKALIELALKPGLSEESYNWWVTRDNNWNQICHGGLSAAAVVIADENPELAAQAISRALDYIPIGLGTYYPDGIYPEGVGYWGYGTRYTIFMVELCETAFGTDFGITESPGFMESARYARLMVSPTGQNYDFFDCYSWMRPFEYWPLLAWFDVRLGESRYFQEESLSDSLKLALEKGTESNCFRLLPIVWMAELEFSESSTVLDESWVGQSENPLVIFRKNNDPRGFYFGAKGGSASLSHANMDAGSFIYEIDGIRWIVDTGNQSYGALEAIIGNGLWNKQRDSARWTLLTKNNMGHSTLTVNDELHSVEGHAKLQQIDEDAVLIDLTETLNGSVASAERTIHREDDYTIVIQDIVIPNETTEKVSFGLLTQADIHHEGDDVILSQDGKSVHVQIIEPANACLTVTSLDPPPLAYDRKIPGLKRIEVVQELNSESMAPIEYEVIIGASPLPMLSSNSMEEESHVQ
ncbi:heparinase II/III domain-containing protein [Rubellicoccus peritrichatus]|uniref:Heparinase II/III family protein n=1 Tax=Rubellicoccus peritrichatus TaxID=3080537 RepID=A0AAQ3LBX2_9BACT|nr:heparinase II/III family protein [Puniceicoccus sp. CR14]WOO41035.1 heparinase II/III family protein [Puniceicoccus sp. CR14]